MSVVFETHAGEVVVESTSATEFRRALPDRALLHDDRVLRAMLKLEERHLPTDYFSNGYKRDVKPHMRKIVAAWMLEVCEEQHCEQDVFPLAISYVDRFLSLVDVPRAQLQLLATTAMFVSSKLKETCPLSARKLVTYTDNSITVDQLLDWETLLLRKLKWDVSTVTPNDFLDYVIHRLSGLDDVARHVVRSHAQTFVALCATDVAFMKCPPSMVAAGCIAAAGVGYRGLHWCKDVRLVEQLHDVTGIDVDFIHQCHLQVDQTLASCLPQGSAGSSVAATPPKGASPPQSQPSTPTDVRDVHLM